MIVIPLGISSATPTAKRHMACVALWREGSVFLFDCGENAQMRMLQAGMKRSKIDYVLISHLDGDHYFGLLGLLSTFQTQRRDKPLTIVGPEGIKKFVEVNMEMAHIEAPYELTINEVAIGTEHKVVVDVADFYIEVRKLDHGTAEQPKFCLGYRFQEKDKPGKVDAEKAAQMGIETDDQYKVLKAGDDVTLEDGSVVRSTDIVGAPRPGHSFAYVTDTRYCHNSVELARNVTLLYHEATFDETLSDKADETGHSTASVAARVAKEAMAHRLVLGHFSARYTNEFVLMKEARDIFDESWIAMELRAVMTDPEHEKGIIKPKVEIESPFKKRDTRPFNRGGGSRGGGRPRFSRGGDNRGGGRPQGDRNFRPRRDYDNRGGSDGRRPYDNRGGSGDYERRSYDNRRPYDNRGGSPRPYDNNRSGDYRPRSYDNRGTGDSRPPRRDYDNRGGDSRPPRTYDNRGGDTRPPRSYDNRDSRPPRTYDDRGGDSRPPRTYDDRSGDSRPPRTYDDNRGRGGNDYRSSGNDYRNKPEPRFNDDRPIKPRTPFDENDRF